MLKYGERPEELEKKIGELEKVMKMLDERIKKTKPSVQLERLCEKTRKDLEKSKDASQKIVRFSCDYCEVICVTTSDLETHIGVHVDLIWTIFKEGKYFDNGKWIN